MKKFCTALAFTLLFSQPALALTVGVFDAQKVIFTSEAGQRVRATLKESYDSKQQLLKEEEKKIIDMEEQYKKKMQVLSKEAKEKQEAELQSALTALQNKSMQYQKEMQALENELKKPILEKVKKAVVDISKRKKLDLTFEVQTAPVYSSSLVDITDEVLAAINKK